MAVVATASKKPRKKTTVGTVTGSNPQANFAPPKGASVAPTGPPKGLNPTTIKPAVPPVPVYGAAPPTAQGQGIRSDAQKAMSGADTDYRDSVYRAVMGLGDPTLIEKYKADPTFAGYQWAVDPNSQFSQLDLAQKEGIQNVDNAAVQGNTFFSGLKLNNQEDVRQNTNFQKAGAGNSFQEALAGYARALAAAKYAYAQANTTADQTDFDAANAIDPTPAAVVSPTATMPAKSAAQRQAEANAFLQKQAHDKAVEAAKKKAKKK